ncbi:hypothetical protein C1646_777876 [Rhizophagus diaphanus]|nr:hypothetical protein C1646_777876 [Rhizophagus diaphanus] [Rhizophagus sp. MUCL 43196]
MSFTCCPRVAVGGDTGKKFSDIGIESKQARTGGRKREWQYILDCSKIVVKLRESGLGDMKKFSDISQADLSENETADIPYSIKNTPSNICAPVASTSGTSKTSKTPEPEIDGPETSKHLKSNEPICKVVNTPSKETNVKHNSSKPINEVSSAILLARA